MTTVLFELISSYTQLSYSVFWGVFYYIFNLQIPPGGLAKSFSEKLFITLTYEICCFSCSITLQLSIGYNTL